MQEERPSQSKYKFDDLQASPIVYSSPLTAPLFLCFNWNDVFEKQGFTESANFYVVAFRSVRKKGADEAIFKRANEAALEEAKRGGGLLRYLQGRVNSQRQCFEVSIWESQAAAEHAYRMPAYADALKVVSKLYESYTLERYSMSATVDNLPAFQLIDKRTSP